MHGPARYVRDLDGYHLIRTLEVLEPYGADEQQGQPSD
jgi:hypothetical protein